MRIKMTKTVRPDTLFLSSPGTILRKNHEYEYKADRDGTIYGICDNGELLAVKPRYFVFLDAPGWIREIWQELFPEALMLIGEELNEK